MYKKRIYYRILFFLLVAGFILRVYNLSHESLWLDELDTLRNIYSFDSTLNVQNKSPLYYICSYFWAKLFGYGDSSLRFPSVIFGVLSILFIFLISRLLFNSKVGIISAFILCISEFHIFYSRMAIVYSPFVCSNLASIYFLLLFLKIPKYRFIFLYSITSVLVLYTHAYGVFTLFFENLFFLSYWRIYKRLTKKWLLAQFTIFILFLPWFFPFIKQVNYVKDVQFFGAAPTLSIMVPIFHEFNNLISWPGVLVLLGLFLLGLISCLKTFEDRRKLIFLLQWFLVPILIPYLFSKLFFNIFLFSRYVIAFSIPYYIFIAKGIESLKRPFSLGLCFCVVCLLNVPSLNQLYNRHFITEWKKAGTYLSKHSSVDEVILVVNYDSMKKMTERYYDGAANIIPLWAPEHSDKEIPRVLSQELSYNLEKGFQSVKSEIMQYKSLWFIFVDNHEYTTFGNYYIERFKSLSGYSGKLKPIYQTGQSRCSRSGISCDTINIYRIDI